MGAYTLRKKRDNRPQRRADQWPPGPSTPQACPGTDMSWNWVRVPPPPLGLPSKQSLQSLLKKVIKLVVSLNLIGNIIQQKRELCKEAPIVRLSIRPGVVGAVL